MTEAELEEHLRGLSAKRDAFLADFNAEAKAARDVLDRLISDLEIAIRATYGPGPNRA